MSNHQNLKFMKTKIFPVILFLFAGMSSLVAGCHFPGSVSGDGRVIKETRSVPSFDGIDISGAFDVYLKQGETQEVIIETDNNLMPLVKTEVTGGVLKIYTQGPIHHITTMKAYVTVK